MKKAIIVLLFLAVGVMAFAQNQQFLQLLNQYEGLADEMERLAPQVERNPNGDHTRQYNNLQTRAENLQSQLIRWQNSMENSPSAQMPSESQLQRLNAAFDRIQRAGLRIVNALLR